MRWALRSALFLLILIVVCVWAASLVESLDEGEDLIEGAVYGTFLIPALVAPFAALYLFILYRLGQSSPPRASRGTAVALSPLLYVLVFFNLGSDLFTSVYGWIYLAAPILFGLFVPLPHPADADGEPVSG